MRPPKEREVAYLIYIAENCILRIANAKLDTTKLHPATKTLPNSLFRRKHGDLGTGIKNGGSVKWQVACGK